MSSEIRRFPIEYYTELKYKAVAQWPVLWQHLTIIFIY